MHEHTASLLVVDDDPKLRELLARYLTQQGFAVTTANDGVAMDAVLTEQHPDLIVLDLMLPGEDGLSIARRLTGSHPDIPLLMLSARGEDIDRIVGLEMGADDYLPKPFNPRELLARVRSVLRRRTAAATTEPDDHQRYPFGEFVLDITAQRLWRDGQEVQLTAGDLALLEVFATHPNRLLSRDQLVDMIKGFERSPFDRSIDVRVTRLRRKIEADTANPVFIRTVWGRGYMFTPRGDQAPT